MRSRLVKAMNLDKDIVELSLLVLLMHVMANGVVGAVDILEITKDLLQRCILVTSGVGKLLFLSIHTDGLESF